MQDQPRLHAEAALAADALLPLAPAQAHYLGTVLRRVSGDRVRLFNARDGEWEATIEILRKERCQVRVERRTRPPAAETGPRLAFAPLKRDATDLVVRMATELGVRGLQPVFTERTVVHRVNTERWRLIATEAAEQCERLGVPVVAEPVRLTDLLGAWPVEQALLVALERADREEDGPERRRAIPLSRWRNGHDRDAAPQPTLLVGPEGGFSPAERRMLGGQEFVVPVTLGRLILRAETAAVAGLSVLRV